MYFSLRHKNHKVVCKIKPTKKKQHFFFSALVSQKLPFTATKFNESVEFFKMGTMGWRRSLFWYAKPKRTIQNVSISICGSSYCAGNRYVLCIQEDESFGIFQVRIIYYKLILFNWFLQPSTEFCFVECQNKLLLSHLETNKRKL